MFCMGTIGSIGKSIAKVNELKNHEIKKNGRKFFEITKVEITNPSNR